MTEFNTRAHTLLLRSYSIGDLIVQFRRVGFDRDCLPAGLWGGEYDYDRHHVDWIRQRMSIEDIMSAAGSPRRQLLAMPKRLAPPSASSFATTHAARNHHAWHDWRKRDSTNNNNNNNNNPSSSQSAAASADFVAMTRHQRETSMDKRAKARLYMRRSQQRQQLAQLELQDQVTLLRRQNQALRAENARLEQILQAASILISYNNNNHHHHDSPSLSESIKTATTAAAAVDLTNNTILATTANPAEAAAGAIHNDDQDDNDDETYNQIFEKYLVPTTNADDEDDHYNIPEEYIVEMNWHESLLRTFEEEM